MCWLFCVCHLSIQTLELVHRYLLNNFLGFWLGLHWVSRSNWEELISWQYWQSVSIDMVYISIYLVLWFCLSEFCSFLQIELCKYFVRFVPKGFHFGGVNVIGLFFLFQILLVVCWYIENNSFCILTSYPTTLLLFLISCRNCFVNYFKFFT